MHRWIHRCWLVVGWSLSLMALSIVLYMIAAVLYLLYGPWWR